MKVKVLYFASLREELERAEETVELTERITLADLWAKVTQQTVLPDHILVAVNQEYTSADTLVNDGDEVAFFPPVTGG